MAGHRTGCRPSAVQMYHQTANRQADGKKENRDADDTRDDPQGQRLEDTRTARADHHRVRDH